MTISGINHVTLLVRDLELSHSFYTNVLGLKRVGQRTHMYFYSSGRFIHELALMHYPTFQNNNSNGLVHLCFNVPDEQSLSELYQQYQSSGIQTSGGVNHIIMHSFYMSDPDGYIIEIGMDRPEHEWANHDRPFEEDRPLDLNNSRLTSA